MLGWSSPVRTSISSSTAWVSPLSAFFLMHCKHRQEWGQSRGWSVVGWLALRRLTLTATSILVPSDGRVQVACLTLYGRR